MMIQELQNPGETPVLDAIQLQGRHQVRIDRSRDALLTEFGRATLDDRYLLPGESYQDLFARVASYYGDDAAHAQRIYDYISRLWLMPATPVLSNGGTQRGLPISCFLNECADSLPHRARPAGIQPLSVRVEITCFGRVKTTPMDGVRWVWGW